MVLARLQRGGMPDYHLHPLGSCWWTALQRVEPRSRERVCRPVYDGARVMRVAVPCAQIPVDLFRLDTEEKERAAQTGF